MARLWELEQKVWFPLKNDFIPPRALMKDWSFVVQEHLQQPQDQPEKPIMLPQPHFLVPTISPFFFLFSNTTSAHRVHSTPNPKI